MHMVWNNIKPIKQGMIKAILIFGYGYEITNIDEKYHASRLCKLPKKIFNTVLIYVVAIT